MDKGLAEEDSLILPLHSVLRDLYINQYPYVPCPGELKKRASVALILRVKPRYEHWPKASTFASERSADNDVLRRMADFFKQSWVQHGDPEVLFIKRSSRQGDRWKGHIALPGGRRDPEDTSDQAAAIRETSEEVGIDLSPSQALAVGNLPQRIVTTSWGKVPLMVLCPYIFLLDKYEMSPQCLQPTEIASTHWVPLRALANPALRTYESQDVTTRLAKQRNGIAQFGLRCLLGKQLFNAIRLVPSESHYCSSIPGFVPAEPSHNSWSFSGLWDSFRRPEQNRQGDAPLLLWGLTLGILTDFLDMLPPHNAVQIWTCPTFTAPDLRVMIWAMSYRYNKRKHAELRGDISISPVSDRTPGPCDGSTEEIVPLVDCKRSVKGRRQPDASAISVLLEGYYKIIVRAIAVTLISRATVLGLFMRLWLRRRMTNGP